MNQKKLFLQLLPGFIPLFIFIIADEVWGTKIGLIVAIATGLAELLFYLVKDKKFDKFILFDTLLIVVLGLVSILLDNEVFFKLKPALIGVLTCIILGISAFTPLNIVFSMSKRYLKGLEIDQHQYKLMQKSLKNMFFIFVAYTFLVFYSVWFMSKEAWAFVSGGLFYIIFGVYILYEFLKKKFKTTQNEEILPLVDKQGNIIGKAPRSICHSSKEYLHPVVHLHIINDSGLLFLQKRPATKKIQPNKWDTAVGGHIAFGETIQESLNREAFEEIGITNFEPNLIAKYLWQSDIETELVFCFVANYNGQINICSSELSDGKFWTKKQIQENMSNGIFTKNFEKEFGLIEKFLK